VFVDNDWNEKGAAATGQGIVWIIAWYEEILKGQKRALVDLQLDAQNSYLFTYNTLIKMLYMFRALPCSSSGGLRRNFV